MTKTGGQPSATGRRPAVRRSGVRKRGWTQTKRKTFLALLQATSNVAEAARTVGIGVSTAYALKRRDPEFAEAWREALDIGYGELEMTLLRHALHGSERIETVRDGATGTIKQIKTVHSYPLALAMRLFLAHRDEVEAFRCSQALHQGQDDVAARVRTQMDEVRARLLGGQTDSDSDSAEDEGDA